MRRLAVGMAALGLAVLSGEPQRAESQGARERGSADVLAYSIPGQPTSEAYDVRVRVPGKAWRSVRAVAVSVDMHTRSKATLVSFDARGPVEVAITKKSGKIASARVRPSSLAITPLLTSDQRTATFTLRRPVDASFEVDGDTLHNLHLLVRPPDRRPSRKHRVVYFGPGEHVVPGAHVLRVRSNTTVYLAPGALIRGSIEVARAHNVVIRGHGAINPSPFVRPGERPTIYIRGSSDVGIRGVTILDGQDGAITVTDSRRVVIAGVSEINVDRFSDGVDVVSSTDVLIDSVFLRTSDDSINVSGSTPWGGHGSTRNITMRNTTLWADVAHPVLVGVGGNPNAHDKVERIVFQNIDVLEHDEANDLYQGALAVNAGDRVTVRNVRFQDVRIAHFTRGMLVNVRVFKNESYNKEAGDGVDEILFRDITYTGLGDVTSRIDGYDAERTVENVVFENLSRNGSVVLTPKAGNISVGPFSGGIVFRAKHVSHVVPAVNRGVRRSEGWIRRGTQLVARGPAALTYSFQGSQARVVGALGPSAGFFRVFLDGRPAGTVDCYGLRPAQGQILYDTGLLARRRHRLVLRATGTRDVLSSGTAVAVSRFELVP